MPNPSAMDKTDDISARTLNFGSIPVIDLGSFLEGQPGAKEKVAEEIGRACRHVGFFYIKNHGISEDVTDELIKQSKRFFRQPFDKKMEVDAKKIGRHRGYIPMGDLSAGVKARPDVQEGFELCEELPADDPDYLAGSIMYGPNVWPDNLPGFREGVYGYFEAVMDLGFKLFHAFEMTLGLPQGWFDPLTDKSMSQLRLIYYPPQEGDVDPKQIGIGAHTDYECFTLLLQDENGGLQVGNRQGEWIEATPIPGTIIVNVGDMLMRWTNDEFVSTPHRVINRSGKERLSFPLFFAANHRTVVRCLPQFQSPDNPPKYPPTRSGWWTETMITDVYEYRAAHRGTVPNPELDWDAPDPID